jgi:hypothetical protein
MNRILITLFLLFVPVASNAQIKLISSDANGFVHIEDNSEVTLPPTVYYIPRANISHVRVSTHEPSSLFVLYIAYLVGQKEAGVPLSFTSKNEALDIANRIIMNTRPRCPCQTPHRGR